MVSALSESFTTPSGAPGAAPRRILLAAALAASATGCAGAGDGSVAPSFSSDTLLAVNGTRLYVHREGEGEAILVVHGGPVLDHGYLVEPLRPLTDGHALVFFDQRLSGRSAGVVDSASVRLDTLVADMEGIRLALGLDRIHLLGHSWGGLLAMKYAATYPDRLRSLVLVSPMPPSAPLWQEEQAAQQAALQPGDTAGMGELRSSPAVRTGEPGALEQVLRATFRGELHDPSLAEGLAFHIEADYRERSRQFGYLLPDLMSYDLRGSLERVQVPTLLIYGADEVGATMGGPAILASIPDVRMERIPDAKHFSFLERPEAFLRVVRAFLRDAGGASASR